MVSTEKNSAKTLIERFGFKDYELTTPRHDEILLWLMQKQNVLKMLCNLKILDGQKDDSIRSIEAEHPILGYNNYNIGFVDLALRIYDDFSQMILIEIKPKIVSIGECLRQISFYRSHIKRQLERELPPIWHSQFVIVTDTPNLKDVFESQFIRYYLAPKQEKTL
jgi:hypothetical protein